MVRAFCPDYQVLLDKVTDEELDTYLTVIKKHIEYIERGTAPEQEK